jgi:hypothetical protein
VPARGEAPEIQRAVLSFFFQAEPTGHNASAARVREEIPVVPRSRRYFKLEIGDIVERRLINGDYVLLNRQPTLHKASMQAFKIIIHPGKSFRFNLACTKAFNADFDGDEMNIHVPQSLEAQAEIKFLSSVKNNIINCQSSKLNLVIVQDGILGLFLMTKRETMPLTREQFFQCTMRISLSSQRVLTRMKESATNFISLFHGTCLSGSDGLLSKPNPATAFAAKNADAPRVPKIRRKENPARKGNLVRKSLHLQKRKPFEDLAVKERSPILMQSPGAYAGAVISQSTPCATPSRRCSGTALRRRRSRRHWPRRPPPGRPPPGPAAGRSAPAAPT